MFLNLFHQNTLTFNRQQTYAVLATGGVVGFLSGLLGKGGSAIATPALQVFAGIPSYTALSSPLPSTLPTTLSACFAYKDHNLIDFKVAYKSILFGIPATLIGSYFTSQLNGEILMVLTALFILGLGFSFLLFSMPAKVDLEPNIPNYKISIVAIGVGFLAGLLANSGGVLFGPLFIRMLKMPTKRALATSLIVAAGLAIPGTIAHWYLGHINWYIVLLLSITSIPCSYLGAKTALKVKTAIIENIFAMMLIAFGLFDLFYTIWNW